MSWDNNGAHQVLEAFDALLTTSRAQEARSMAAEQSTKPESWLPVVGWEGFYEVSDRGRVRSVGTSRLMSLRPNWEGYVEIRFSNTATGRRERVRVHRLVATAFIENQAKHPEVNHLNGKKSDNVVENLEWTTPSGNRKHAWDTGLINPRYLRSQAGEGHAESKLTNATVAEARLRHRDGESIRSLARVFKVDAKTMRLAIKGLMWKHVPMPESKL